MQSWKRVSSCCCVLFLTVLYSATYILYICDIMMHYEHCEDTRINKQFYLTSKFCTLIFIYVETKILMLESY